MTKSIKLKFARLLLFFSGMTIGMAIARLMTYVIGTCPFGMTGIVVLLIMTVTMFLGYILLVLSYKEEIEQNKELEKDY